MLTADINDKPNSFKVAFLTVSSIFIMGYLNALALNTYDLGSMLTPQTGNIIWLGINAASGYWGYFIENLGLFFGFMIGAVFALFTHNLFRNKNAQFFWNWSFFVIPIAIYPLVFQYMVQPAVSFFVLGFSAGATLGFFRKIYHMEINTSMATGNVRFLGLHFAQAFIKKDTKGDKKEIFTFWIFFVSVFAFALGAFVYGVFARIDSGLASELHIGLGRSGYIYERLTFGRYETDLSKVTNVTRYIALVVFCIIPYFFCPKNAISK